MKLKFYFQALAVLILLQICTMVLAQKIEFFDFWTDPNSKPSGINQHWSIPKDIRDHEPLKDYWHLIEQDAASDFLTAQKKTFCIFRLNNEIPANDPGCALYIALNDGKLLAELTQGDPIDLIPIIVNYSETQSIVFDEVNNSSLTGPDGFLSYTFVTKNDETYAKVIHFLSVIELDKTKHEFHWRLLKFDAKAWNDVMSQAVGSN